VRAEEYDKSEDFDRKTHEATPTNSRHGRDHGHRGFIVNAAPRCASRRIKLVTIEVACGIDNGFPLLE
jgi:hypothetical protein